MGPPGRAKGNVGVGALPPCKRELKTGRAPSTARPHGFAPPPPSPQTQPPPFGCTELWLSSEPAAANRAPGGGKVGGGGGCGWKIHPAKVTPPAKPHVLPAPRILTPSPVFLLSGASHTTIRPFWCSFHPRGGGGGGGEGGVHPKPTARRLRVAQSGAAAFGPLQSTAAELHLQPLPPPPPPHPGGSHAPFAVIATPFPPPGGVLFSGLCAALLRRWCYSPF